MQTNATDAQERTDPADADQADFAQIAARVEQTTLGEYERAESEPALSGTPETVACPACRTAVVPCRDYCPECGAPVGGGR